MIAMTAVYILILPILSFIPHELIATPDGERNPVLEAQPPCGGQRGLTIVLI